MTPAIPAASASAAPRRAGKGAAPATPAWSAQPPSRTAAHANTAFAGAPRIPRPPSPQAARAPALFAPSPPLAHAAQTVPQPQAIPTQTHPIHRSSIKVGNDARTLKGVSLRVEMPIGGVVRMATLSTCIHAPTPRSTKRFRGLRAGEQEGYPTVTG